MRMGWIWVVPTACWPSPHTNSGVPGVRPRMPDFLSMVGKGPKGGRKTRAPGSHRPEQRQRQALPRDDAPVAAATSPPAVTHGDAVALAFPRKSNLGKQQQQEEADMPRVPGISSQPCAPRGFFLATTLSRSREQPVSRLRAATKTAGEWGALPAPPEHLHAATPHPRVPTQQLLGLAQQCRFHPPNCSRMLSVMRWAARGCLSPLPSQGRPQNICLWARRAPAICCQAAEGSGRNVYGKQVLPADKFAVLRQHWERGPDVGVWWGREIFVGAEGLQKAQVHPWGN